MMILLHSTLPATSPRAPGKLDTSCFPTQLPLLHSLLGIPVSLLLPSPHSHIHIVNGYSFLEAWLKCLFLQEAFLIPSSKSDPTCLEMLPYSVHTSLLALIPSHLLLWFLVTSSLELMKDEPWKNAYWIIGRVVWINSEKGLQYHKTVTVPKTLSTHVSSCPSVPHNGLASCRP